jgi:hypothetical protein
MPTASAAWIDLFVLRLGKLRPSISVEEASRIALQVHPDADDLDPEEAAEIYVTKIASAHEDRP